MTDKQSALVSLPIRSCRVTRATHREPLWGENRH